MRHKILVLLAVTISLIGCSSDEPGERKNIRRPIEISNSQQEILTVQNEFAVRLFSEALSRGNQVISPLSVSLAMSMAANGAAGETYNEISKVLGFEDTDISEVNTMNLELIERLPRADCNTTLAVANSLWINNNVDINTSFSIRLSEYYRATSENLDLSSQKSVDRINGWVSDKTRGKIANILTKPLGGEVAMINSLYFKSMWAAPFPKKNTRTETFHNENGTLSDISMMFSGPSNSGFMYEGSTVVRIPYGNGSFYFTAVLPPAEIKIGDYLKSLDGTILKKWHELFTLCDPALIRSVKVGMPKFSTTSGYDLIPLLEKLGINRAFTSLADFSRMCEVPVMLTAVLQKATINVDEDGVVATSATVAVGGITDVGPLPIEVEEVVFDRPFIYYISEYSTGAILFIGNVSEF